MKSINIFQEKYVKNAPPAANARFFSFTKVGDRIQGTYIRAHAAKDKFRGNCKNYEIKDSNENVWLIGGGKEGEGIIDKEMANVNPGMIVGIELVELRDTGKGNLAKIYRIYYDENIVDSQFMAQFTSETSNTNPSFIPPKMGETQNEINVPSTPAEIFPNQTPSTTVTTPSAPVGVPSTTAPLTPPAAPPNSVPSTMNPIETAPTSTQTSDNTIIAGTVNEQKIKTIFDLSKQKLGAINATDAKQKIMKATGLALIAPNIDLIIEKLEAMDNIK